MPAHQEFGQFFVASGDRGCDLAVLIQRGLGALWHLSGTQAAHANQVVEFAVQVLQNPLVAAGDRDAIVEVDIATIS